LNIASISSSDNGIVHGFGIVDSYRAVASSTICFKLNPFARLKFGVAPIAVTEIRMSIKSQLELRQKRK